MSSSSRITANDRTSNKYRDQEQAPKIFKILQFFRSRKCRIFGNLWAQKLQKCLGLEIPRTLQTLAPETAVMLQSDFWAQKVKKYCNVWAQKLWICSRDPISMKHLFYNVFHERVSNFCVASWFLFDFIKIFIIIQLVLETYLQIFSK